jgi:hypothetical protein
MLEKAVIGGKIAIALGIMCIVLLAGLGAAIASYTSIISSKDKANQDYVSMHSHDNTEFNSLDTSLNDYVETHSHTNSQYDEYAASHHHTDQEFDSVVTAPKLVTVDLTTEDDWSTVPYVPSTFLVYGYVANAGSDAAYNPKIHVVAYELPNVKAIDAYATLATIDGGSWTTFSSTFVYSGGPLFNWTIAPQWTTTP